MIPCRCFQGISLFSIDKFYEEYIDTKTKFMQFIIVHKSTKIWMELQSSAVNYGGVYHNNAIKLNEY